MPRKQRSIVSDMDRVRAMKDEDIDLSDSPELTAAWFADADLRMPEKKQPVSLRVDQDVIAYFRSLGPGYQTRMNQVLQSYVRVHRSSDRRQTAQRSTAAVTAKKKR